jgi:acetyl-CoA carboxylase biotin carboxyl carrier protein
LAEAKPSKMSERESLNEQTEGSINVESRESGQPNRRRRHRSRQIDPSVNMDELRELIDLIQENGFAEFEISREGFRLHVRRDAVAPEVIERGGASSPHQGTDPTGVEAQASSGSAPLHPGAHAQSAASEDQDLHMISSPIVGTFYRSPSPNADPFVKIGSSVDSDTVVCIIEAMKLMNEIQAETAGEVVKIYVENGQPVEYGQPLFGIKR